MGVPSKIVAVFSVFFMVSTGLSTVYATTVQKQSGLFTEKKYPLSDAEVHKNIRDSERHNSDISKHVTMSIKRSLEVDHLGKRMIDWYESSNDTQSPRDSIEIDNETWDMIVPDDFPTIQMAVNAVGLQYGYRIFVRLGTYNENVMIKTDGVVLQGESKETTVIDGALSGCVINISCNYSEVSGFTIRNKGNEGVGIELCEANGNHIDDIIVTDTAVGVWVHTHSHSNNISGCRITENDRGGVYIDEFCTGNLVFDSLIQDNNLYGLKISKVCRMNFIIGNTITGHQIGMSCTNFSEGNWVYHNSFIGNEVNGFDDHVNSWDDGAQGNYWDDYTGRDDDNDGVGDTPYPIAGGSNVDQFPLMMQPMVREPCFFARYFGESKKSGGSCSPVGSSSYTGDVIIIPDDYPTIQEGVDHAEEGDTVFVRAGHYYEHVIVNSSIKLKGEGVGMTIVDGSNENKHIIKVMAESVELCGVSIQNCGVGFSGVRVYGAFCHIHDTVITACGGGIELWSSNESILQENLLTHNTWGIYVDHCYGCICTDNSLLSNVYGLEVGISTIDILHNTIKNNSESGMLQALCYGCLISNNTLSYNKGVGCQLFECNNTLIRDNSITYNLLDGITFSKSAYNRIINNSVQSNLLSGISLWFLSNDNTVKGNHVSSNTEQGITLHSSHYNTLFENVIDGSFDGLCVYSSTDTMIQNNSLLSLLRTGILLFYTSTTKIINNVINNTRDGVTLYYCFQTTIKYNAISFTITDGIGLYYNSTTTDILENNFAFCLYGIGTNGYDYSRLEDTRVIGNTFSHISRLSVGFYNTYNTTIVNNTIGSNGVNIIFDDPEGYNTITMENNYIQGKPIYFLKNINKGWELSDAVQIFLFNCSNFLIQHCNFSVVTTQITLASSHNNTIMNNIFSNGNDGIAYQNSCMNTFKENIVNHNKFLIIYDYSDKNTFSSNYFKNDSYILFADSCGNIVSNNTFENDYYGAKFYYNSSYNRVIGNTLSNTTICFMSENSNDNEFAHNAILNNFNKAFYLKNSSNTLVMRNTIYNAKVEFGTKGIIIADSSSCKICENRITNFTPSIDIANSTTTIISKNVLQCSTIDYSVNTGRDTSSTSFQANISSSNISHCEGSDIEITYEHPPSSAKEYTVTFFVHGISVVKSIDSIIENNHIFNITDDGIYVKLSSQTTIQGNILFGNSYGIFLEDSSKTFLIGNTLHDNMMHALNLQYCESTILYKNNFEDNNHQVNLESSRYTLVYRNYWDDWIGLEYIFLQFMPYHLVELVYDWHPAQEPYEIPSLDILVAMWHLPIDK